MLAGCEKLADAVSVTLGPKGRAVVIDQPFGGPRITKDGVTVAKSIEFANRLHNVGAQLVKQVASATNDAAGDGTTTATVLARAIYRAGCEAVAAGMNPMDLLRGINLAVDAVVAFLERKRKAVVSANDVLNVATISANGDRRIGELIAKAMDKVGLEGTIAVSEGRTIEHELELVEGLKLDRGFISPYFVTNQKSQKVEMDDCFILFHDKRITTIKSIVPILERVVTDRSNLLIVAEDVDGDALATLVLNKLRLGLNIAAIKAPGFGDHRKALLHDVAALTGGTVVTEDSGMKLDEVGIEVLGRAKNVTISKDETVILAGAGDRDAIMTRCDQIRSSIDTTQSEYEKEKLKERLGKLVGGVAVLKVGGASEVEVNEAKDRVQDALNATKAAVEEGVVPGGGAALLFAARELESLVVPNDDQRVAVRIVADACRAPLKQIAQNAGHEGAVIAGNLLRDGHYGSGFDAQTGAFVDMFEAGILDPTKVVKCALKDAASVAGLMTTTEAAIVDVPTTGKGCGGGGAADPSAGGADFY
eukprot:Polyplicarium_translucidae@DN1778_c0_g1_i2.p1